MMPTPEQIETMRAQVAQYDQERIDEANLAAAGAVELAAGLADEMLGSELAARLGAAGEQAAGRAPQLASVLHSMERLVELLPSAIERGKAQAFQAIRAEQTGNGESGVDEPEVEEPVE